MDSKEFKERLENRAHEIGKYSTYDDISELHKKLMRESHGHYWRKNRYENMYLYGLVSILCYIFRRNLFILFVGVIAFFTLAVSCTEYHVITPLFYILLLIIVFMLNITYIRQEFHKAYIIINFIVIASFIILLGGGYCTNKYLNTYNLIPAITGYSKLKSGKENFVIADKNTYIVSPVLTTEQIVHRINQDFHTGIYHYDDKAYENKVLLYDYYNNLIGSYDRRETKSGYICVHFETWKQL